jgi:alkylation response protein AidB-like acyl-CoA dehydrogenase
MAMAWGGGLVAASMSCGHCSRTVLARGRDLSSVRRPLPRDPEMTAVDLRYDTEHELLRDSAEKFLAERYDYRTFQRISQSDPGWSREIWADFANLGWLGLPFAPDDGGSGGSAVELAILMEAFGRHLVIEPYLATVVLGGGLIAALGSENERRTLLPALIDGDYRLAFAHEDRGPPTQVARTCTGHVLRGAKKVVLGGEMADTLLVSAAFGDGRIGVFVLPKATRGLTLRPYRLVDGGRAADVEIADVTVPQSALLGGNEDAGDAVAAVLDRAIAALSADAVGAIAAMVKATVDYAKTRVQFGQPLANFQALQHRMVKLKIKEEEARAAALFATLSLDGPADMRGRAVCGAKAKIGRCARFVHQDAIQLHGAIGTTNELALGGYAKRLIAYEILFGSTREHLRRYGAIIADPEVAAKGLLLAPAN